jgi:hypothetical protein
MPIAVDCPSETQNSIGVQIRLKTHFSKLSGQSQSVFFLSSQSTHSTPLVFT